MGFEPTYDGFASQRRGIPWRAHLRKTGANGACGSLRRVVFATALVSDPWRFRAPHQDAVVRLGPVRAADVGEAHIKKPAENT